MSPGDGVAKVDPAILKDLAQFDSPTVFNALVQLGGLPNEEYTDHTIRCLLPELGPVVGYAVTAEIATNDPDSPSLPWDDYYEWLNGLEGPLVTVMKDIDSRPGRGASFGDGMAGLHRRLGVVGAIVDGTVRDVPGIGRVGLPIWAWGAVPGHGVFHLVRFGESTTTGQLRVHTGDLIFADADGCVRIPVAQASEVAAAAAEVRKMEADIHGFVLSDDFTFSEWKARAAARK
jgi:regulator of RNase E activity RraA